MMNRIGNTFFYTNIAVFFFSFQSFVRSVGRLVVWSLMVSCQFSPMNRAHSLHLGFGLVDFAFDSNFLI